MDLTGLIGFNVEFDFTNVPTLVLQSTTTIPDIDKPNLSGHFSITQPDGITTTGVFGSIVWNGTGYNTFSEILRLGSDGTYQKGVYHVVFFAQCTGYVYSQISRVWDMEYKPVIKKLTPQLDCFTPSLKYNDNTIYGVGGYNILTQSNLWTLNSIPGNSTSSTSILDLVLNGYYYDCIYNIGYSKFISYQHSSFIWLSVSENFRLTIVLNTQKPASMEVMLGYLINLELLRDSVKGNSTKYSILDSRFKEASNLFQIIKARICTSNISGLINTFVQFYNITHNYTPQIYTHTNLPIPGYDTSSWCGTTSSTGAFTLFYSALVDGETTAPFIIPNNARIDFVVKEIKTLQPSQYNWNGTNITLLGGMQLSAGETIEVHYIL